MKELTSLSEHEYETLPPSDYGVPFNGSELVEMARVHRVLQDRITQSSSGAPSAALEALTADMFSCIARGKDADAVVDLCRRKWLEHCESNNRRIRAASLAQSLPQDQWCSPVAFASRAQFVLSMVPDEEPTVKVFAAFNR
jgi:hypothetical protein